MARYWCTFWAAFGVLDLRAGGWGLGFVGGDCAPGAVLTSVFGLQLVSQTAFGINSRFPRVCSLAHSKLAFGVSSGLIYVDPVSCVQDLVASTGGKSSVKGYSSSWSTAGSRVGSGSEYSVLLMFLPTLCDGVVGARYARNVSGYAYRANVNGRECVRVSDYATCFVSIVRLANDRVLQGVGCRVCLFIVRRFGHLQVLIQLAQPMSRNALGTVLNGDSIYSANDVRFVPLVSRRANHPRRVCLLLKYANEGRGALFEGAVAGEGRNFRGNAKNVEAGATGLANEDRVCTRREVNLLRAIRKRL